jgi:hypothetical protein
MGEMECATYPIVGGKLALHFTATVQIADDVRVVVAALEESTL